MDESNVWGAQRFVTLLVVLALHLGVLALLLMISPTRIPAVATNNSVELMFFPPTKVRFDHARPQRLNVATAVAVTLPGLTAPSLAPPSSGADGNAAAVNWVAEAHRAVQAVEIRRNHPPNVAISASPWSDWWPREHHAGDRYKTENGDWIVWISANCYQVARWGPGAFGSTPSPTICPRQSDSRGDNPPPDSTRPTQ
jgi:hypothetical protein